MADGGLASWHDFNVVMGTAAATLEGLMFVAASVGTGVFTEERQIGLRTFLSPTVVAFAGVLALALIGVAPVRSAAADAVLIGGAGLLGLAYSARVWQRMVQHGLASSVDLEDRVWYAAAPAFAYFLLAADGLGFALAAPAAPSLLAVGTGTLLVAGLRNAWDITTWVVLRRRD